MVGRTLSVSSSFNHEGDNGRQGDMSRLSIQALLSPSDNLDQPKFEHLGRKYYERWFDVYPFPSDESEQERLDALHEAFYNVALEGKLHMASLRPGRMRVLDVGYGSGIWAISMAQQYPNADVIAIDIGNDHPHPPGVNFGVKWISGVDFTTDDWGLSHEEPFDFIHMGQLCGSVPDWGLMFRRAYGLLKYGGQIESLEFDWTPLSKTTVPPNSPVNEWWHYMQNATASTGKRLGYPSAMQDILHDAGFNILNHRVVDVPAAEDYRLPPDDLHNSLARWYRYIMFTPLFKTIRGLSMALFTRQLGQKPEQVTALVGQVNAILNAVHSPYYHKVHVVTGRKR